MDGRKKLIITTITIPLGALARHAGSVGRLAMRRAPCTITTATVIRVRRSRLIPLIPLVVVAAVVVDNCRYPIAPNFICHLPMV